MPPSGFQVTRKNQQPMRAITPVKRPGYVSPPSRRKPRLAATAHFNAKGKRSSGVYTSPTNGSIRNLPKLGPRKAHFRLSRQSFALSGKTG